jgi:hypothetical protein
LERLSLDRWDFFHPRLGYVFFFFLLNTWMNTKVILFFFRPVRINCTGLDDFSYNCSVDRENKCSGLKSCHKLPSMKSDADAIAEYVENYHIRTNLRLIGSSNKLAFPHGN